ncbi:MAG: hypothetical protein H5T44_03355 [Thermoplasmatales archaeon]|nr:hypothetical protein [Thermoplasmatales archaeon]
MGKKGLLAVVTIAIVYFVWLILWAFLEFFTDLNLPISLKVWSIIGIFLYIALILIEILFMIEREKKEEIPKKIKKVVCGYCKTKFDISDTGERPLNYICPNCGNEGALKGKTLKGISIFIECSNCGKEAEIFYSGERPFEYVCPHCHAKGIIND